MKDVNLYTLFFWQACVLFAGVVFSSEFLLRSNLKNLIEKIFSLLTKVFRVLSSSHTSDKRKGVLMSSYSRKLLLYSVFFLTKILLTLAPIIAGFWISFGLERVQHIITLPSSIVIITAISLTYLFVRIR